MRTGIRCSLLSVGFASMVASHTVLSCWAQSPASVQIDVNVGSLDPFKFTSEYGLGELRFVGDGPKPWLLIVPYDSSVPPSAYRLREVVNVPTEPGMDGRVFLCSDGQYNGGPMFWIRGNVLFTLNPELRDSSWEYLGFGSWTVPTEGQLTASLEPTLVELEMVKGDSSYHNFSDPSDIHAGRPSGDATRIVITNPSEITASRPSTNANPNGSNDDRYSRWLQRQADEKAKAERDKDDERRMRILDRERERSSEDIRRQAVLRDIQAAAQGVRKSREMNRVLLRNISTNLINKHKNTSYSTKDGHTHCNAFVADFIKARFGVKLPEIFKADGTPWVANDMFNNLRAASLTPEKTHWESIGSGTRTPSGQQDWARLLAVAQRAADDGLVVLISHRFTTGKDPHGHIAVVMPSPDGKLAPAPKLWRSNFGVGGMPYVAQAGLTTKSLMVFDSFNQIAVHPSMDSRTRATLTDVFVYSPYPRGTLGYLLR